MAHLRDLKNVFRKQDHQREQAAREQQQAIAQAAAEQQKIVFDRLGRQVEPGQLVMILQPQLVLRVKDVRPVVNPKAPPGSVQVELVFDAPMVYQGGLPSPGFIIVAPAPSRQNETQPVDEPTESDAPARPVEIPLSERRIIDG